jgi:hypothetical protein
VTDRMPSPRPRRRARVLALASVALLLAAAPVAAADRLVCDGPLGPKTNHADVVARWGKDVRLQKIDGAEGETLVATVVFGDDPAHRLELIWADEARRQLDTIRLSPRSAWITPDGLAIGATLAEVEKANGRPFALSGFEWDYGGTVTDWKGGALAAPLPGGCIVAVVFGPSPKASDAARAAVAGDRGFSSDDRKMRAAQPIVTRLSLGYPR